MRTYAGHSSAKESNELFRTNLTKGQTGLSIAFDLPTQTGYDPEDPMSRGEVGKVGVSIASLADMRTLFEGLPLTQMNTSMTINATAVWLYSLYIALADEQGAPRELLSGTTQNDIIKEYLSRGTYAFPPAPSLEIATDLVAFSVVNTPKWNPINICSYHLQEAGASAVQEVAFALAAAISVLDSVKAKIENQNIDVDFSLVVARMSFFVNGSIRFIDRSAENYQFWKDPQTQDPKEWQRFGKKIRELTGGEDPDIVFEHPGRETFGASVYVARKGGTIVTCASTSGFMHEYDNRYLWMSLKRIVGTHFANYREAFEANRLVAKGLIHPTLSQVFPLEQAGDAAFEVHRNLHQGKVGILALSPQPGLGVTNPDLRAKVLVKINRFTAQ